MLLLDANRSLDPPRLELRWYQQAAVDAVLACWQREPDSVPLVVLPTGSGKSVVGASLARRYREAHPQGRVLSVVHVKELVGQNYAAFRRAWPEASAGIYSASFGRKDRSADVTFATVQSVARVADSLGSIGLLIIDESHLIPHTNDGLYRQLITALRAQNAQLRIVGMTATPWRLASGNLVEPYLGTPPLFSDIAYELTIAELLMEGHLAPVVGRRTQAIINVSEVKTRHGEFVSDKLNAAVNTEDLNQAIVAETIAAGADRKGWIAFAVSVDHAHRLRDLFRERGISAETVTGGTPREARDRIIADFKAGKIRCLTSMGVLTTGFDAPHIDLICMARPTCSPGLFIQMVGRGMRPAPGKSNCLLLDFAGNVPRHGLVDQIEGVFKSSKAEPEAAEAGEQLPRVLACPKCQVFVSAEKLTCPLCLTELPRPQRASREEQLGLHNLTDEVATKPEDLRWRNVLAVRYRLHMKAGSAPSMRIDYDIGEGLPVSEWVCIEHLPTSFARKKAEETWRRRSRFAGLPTRAAEAVRLAPGHLAIPRRVLVKSEGTFQNVKAVQL